MININNTPWDKLNFSDILELLDRSDDETFFFEFKSDDARNQTLHKEISAFANTYGGYILLGISDDKTISGCKAWNEQRIHNVIYNGISPTPIFDVKKLVSDGKTVFVIKIEEGPMPPYITTDGKMYERVSSGSILVKDSAKLSQLYTKQSDSLRKLDNKIGIEPLHRHNDSPANLCGYIDLGFEVQCMDKRKVAVGFSDFDYSIISQYLKEKCGPFSISKVGYTRVITIGEMQAVGEKGGLILPEAAMHNFIVLMNDGSVKYRICLFADDKGMVDLGKALFSQFIFRNIYKLVYKDNLCDNYIYARKYAQLVVLKQFTTYFTDSYADSLGMRLEEHIAKYGNNLIVCGNRMPYNDYMIVDRRYMDSLGVEFNSDEIITELFYDAYTVMGMIDRSKRTKADLKQSNQSDNK